MGEIEQLSSYKAGQSFLTLALSLIAAIFSRISRTTIWIFNVLMCAGIVIFPSESFAEKGNTHGQIGGSFRLNFNGDSRAIVGYYLQDLEQLHMIKNWIIDRDNSTLLKNSVSIYNSFVITVHPNSVIEGKINPRFTGFLVESDINSINNDLEDLAIKRDGCFLLPMAFGDKVKGRVNVIQFFVYDGDSDKEVSQGEIEACLYAGFRLAK